MSTFRDIIARRRPSQPPQRPDADTTEAAPAKADPLEDMPAEIQALCRSETAETRTPSARADDVPRWQPKPPRKTMADGLAPIPGKTAATAEPKPLAKAEVKEPDSPRLNIWDLEKDGNEETVEPNPLLLDPKQTVAPEVPAPTPKPAAAAQGNGRAKTRLLGFHSNDDVSDAFATERVASAPLSIKCPIGWVVVVDGPGRGSSFALAQGLSTVGRGEDQTIPLSFGDDSISRDNHASIAFDEEENKVLIGHGGKSNLVRVNGKPLVSSQELQNGDQIRIGKTTLRFVALCGPDFRWSDSAPEASVNE